MQVIDIGEAIELATVHLDALSGFAAFVRPDNFFSLLHSHVYLVTCSGIRAVVS